MSDNINVRELKPHDLVECARCGKSEFVENAKDWTIVFDMGVVVGFLCPDCQTDEESLEAQVNAATVDYSKSKVISSLPELLETFRPSWVEVLEIIAKGEQERGNALLNEYLERFRKAFNGFYRYELDAQLSDTAEAFALLKDMGEWPFSDLPFDEWNYEDWLKHHR